MYGRAYFKSPKVEIYVEGEVTSYVEPSRGEVAVGLLPFHKVSILDGVEARRRTHWPDSLFIVGKPRPVEFRQGILRLREVERVDCEEFKKAVEIAKDALAKGDLFQLVLARYVAYRGAARPDVVLKKLAESMDGKYYFFLQVEDLWVAGVSPETLVYVEGDRAVSGPIGGTRPRGRDREEDEMLERELVHSVKERAEHIMLVDSVRNDMGRVCKWGTVKARDVATVEKYSYVQHLVSYVECILERGVTPVGAAAAINPTTTVTGVPKPRAIEYINQLEREPRGPFTGAIGAVWPGGGDFAVVIRSTYGEGDYVYVWGGAGIVTDSDPDRECQETEVKMRPIVKTFLDAVE
ncbi:MAG: anthranilate synthase component I family protein [Pyrobaculum sp.]